MSDKVCLQICTFNRGHLLKNTLEKLTTLTKPFELMIVDDGSTDNTKEIIDSFRDRLPIKYIFNYSPTWGIVSIPRNIGVKNTDCEIIITLEPELLPTQDFIPLMLDLHNKYPNQVINAGSIYHGGVNSKTTQQLIENPFSILNNHKLVNHNNQNPNPTNTLGYVLVQGWVATFCALYRRSWIIDKVSGWCQKMTTYSWDDTDMITRLDKTGIGEKICEELVFIHQYHEKLHHSITHRVGEENEAIFRAKNFDINDPNNDIKANKGIEWGVIIPRP